MGGTLPVLAQLVASRAESLGVRAGGLYAVNTPGRLCRRPGRAGRPASFVRRDGRARRSRHDQPSGCGMGAAPRSGQRAGSHPRRARARRGVSRRAGPSREALAACICLGCDHARARGARVARIRAGTREFRLLVRDGDCCCSRGARGRGGACALSASARDRTTRARRRLDGRARVSGWCCSPRCSCASRASTM